MRNFYILFLLMIGSFQSFAQKYDNVWIHIYPGQDTTGNSPLDPPYPAVNMNFSASPPILEYTDSPYMGDVITPILCNKAGLPVIYSNGYNIFHLNGMLLEGGDSLLPIAFQESYPTGYFERFSMMFLPKSKYENDYYVLQSYIEPNWSYTPKILLSSIKGASTPTTGLVDFKNKVIFEGHTRIDYFNATKHANGRDWWVVFSDIDTEAHTRKFYSICLTPDTAYLAQSQQFSGYETVLDHAWEIYTSQRVFSPDGKFFISHDPINGIRIHPFDRCTGELGPLTTLPFQMGHWGSGGIAVSPNSRYLYAANTEYIFQYDLTALDIEATKDTVGIYDGYLDPSAGQPVLFGFPQLGPDGKIYYFAGGIKWVHMIAKPNKKGVTCSVIQRAFKMEVNAEGNPFYPNYRLGPLDGTSCDSLGLNNEPVADFWWFADSTLSVEFSDNSSYEPAQWSWDFGDGGMSQDTSPIHLFPGAGTYNVCLTVSNQYATNTICKAVALGGVATAEPDKSNTLLLSPNPTTGLLHWQYSGNETLTVQVYNLLGQLIMQETTQENQLDLGNLSSGVYLLEFREGSRRYLEKVIKQ